MKKFSLILTLAIMMASSAVFAGSSDYLGNQSAQYIMNTARNASTDASADISVYNPAGTALMGEGVYLSVSSQTLLKYYDSTITNSAGDKASFKQDVPTPVVPSAFVVWNMGQVGAGKLATYLQLSIVAGGGSLEWDGNPYLFALSNTAKADITGSGVYFGEGLGVAYSLLDDMISFSLGGKLVQGKRTQDLKATAFGTLYANQKYEFNATGYNGVVGLNCKPMPELTIGLTYQTATKLDFKYEKETYDVSTLLQSLLPRVEGLKMRRDLPQIISAGVEYAAMPELSISLSGVMYLMNKADLGKIGGPTAPTSKDVNKYFGPGYEVGLGVVYKVMPELKVGGTFMYTTQAGKDELYTDSAAHLFVSGNPVLDSLMFGAGVQYTVMPNLDITFAGNWVHYLPKEYTISANNAKGKYEKEVYTIALGVGYKI